MSVCGWVGEEGTSKEGDGTRGQGSTFDVGSHLVDRNRPDAKLPPTFDVPCSRSCSDILAGMSLSFPCDMLSV